MNNQFGDHGFDYPWRYVTGKSSFIDMFKDEHECRNEVTSCFRRITILTTWWLHSYLNTSLKTNVASRYSTSSYWSITWNYRIGRHWIHGFVFVCLYWQNIQQWLLHFCCFKACGSTLLLEPVEIVSFRKKTHVCMLPLLFGPSLIGKLLPAIFIFSRFRRKRLAYVTSDWLVTIYQSLLLINYGILLKMHWQLYFYMSSNLCTTQFSGKL